MTAIRSGFLATIFVSLIALGSQLPEPGGLSAQPQPVAVTTPPQGDGRVATVVDSQGAAMVRPVGRERWSLLAPRDLLMPGDLVRTSIRGANVLELELSTGGKVVLGPGGLAEFAAPGQLRLLRGELEVRVARGEAVVTVFGPGGFERAVDGRLLARVVKRRMQVLEKAPRWLTGYRKSTTAEWVGSLVAKVDGRELSLSVGYHHVDAVIRDQIAQTTVEQSFINSTDSRLEGVFYFPLPADASISGFGMWIGGELVEADIVEKQRARQIYEDILRRKKDPGLLEWSGGNLFKARVFPIEPHSEKRIRIRYTQVLRMEGSTLRYRYALRSELLRQRPLRDLKIKISLASATAIEAVASTTHEVRVRHTEHAASLEYDAQEVTPEADFEARITLARSAPLTVVPHRRGEDGYFMLLLSPPDGSSGKWRRELMPEGAPMDLIVVADTSASMDVAARQSQAAFIRGLLGLLGGKDRFRLMTADIDVQNFSAEPVAVGEQSIESAMGFLQSRDSLGWTDLDQVLGQIQRQARPGSVVVYVGDGIGTTGDADPVALARRIRRLGGGCKAVVHAVSTGATFERGVLAAMAEIGGGSVRSVGEDALAAAYALLAEAARPAIKELKIEFRGVRVARAYPETLPNLPTGTQQVVLGRYLPTGRDQQGTVVVSGRLAGEPVRYTAPFAIAAGEAGNSFIPRLWARRHLDGLLSQGRSAAVKADIVGFSQEFGIITPYTSFLVLENDADRKRYGVERRVRMRDGEAFFATGRDAANTELLRQQMRRAKTYRLQLRLRMLAEIDGLGRGLHTWQVGYATSPSGGGTTWGGLRRGRGPGPTTGGPAGNLGRDFLGGELGRKEAKFRQGGREGEQLVDESLGFSLQDKKVEASEDMDLPRSTAMNSPGPMESRARRPSRRAKDDGFLSQLERLRKSSSAAPMASPPVTNLSMFGFPALAAPEVQVEEPKLADWSAEIRTLVAELDRRSRLRESKQAFRLQRRSQRLHARQGKIVTWSAVHGCFAAGDWWQRSSGRGEQPVARYSFGGQRAVVAESLALGRRRPVAPLDRRFRFPLADYSTIDFIRIYHRFRAELVGGTRLVLRPIAAGQSRYEFLIDRERRVVTRAQTIDTDGQVTRTTTFADFVERSGMFWAQRVEQRDHRDRVVKRWTLQVEMVGVEAARQQMAAVVKKHDQVVFIGQRDVKLEAAKQALHLGQAGDAEQLRLVSHYFATQQWQRVWEAFARTPAVQGAWPAVPMLRLLLASRRGEEFHQQLRGLVAVWVRQTQAAQPVAGIDFLVGSVVRWAAKVLSEAEQLSLLESLEPVYRRATDAADLLAQADARYRDLLYRRQRSALLTQLQRRGEALALRAETASRYPGSFAVVQDYLAALAGTGDRRTQVQYLAAKLAEDRLWTATEIRFFYRTWVEALYALRDLAGLRRVAVAWVEADPEHPTAYACRTAAGLFRNRTAEVHEAVAAQLAAPVAEAKIAHARQLAAVRFALGGGWNMATNQVAPQWQRPLAELVRRCTRAGGAMALQISREVAASWYFRRTDAWRQLRHDLVVDLFAEDGIAKMSLPQLAVYMQWIAWDRNSIEVADWQRARQLFMARFDAAADAGEQAVLGGYVMQVLDAYQAKEQALGFLRQWLAAAKTQPELVARQLFNRLLAAEWTAELENEAFALIDRLLPARAEPATREAQLASSIRHLASRLSVTRLAVELGPAPALEKLSRQQRRDKTKTAQQRVRQALAARLGTAAAAAEARARRWFELERLGYAAQAGGDRQATVVAAMALLKTVPGSGKPGEPQASRLLRERLALTMAFAATRRGAAAEVAATVLQVFRSQLTVAPRALDWRYQTYRLLLALDRSLALAEELQRWIDPGKAEMVWRRTLAFLHAEGGDVAKAVRLLEGVENADELLATDYDALHNWYLVLGDDVRRQRALLRHFEVTPEWQLSNRLGTLQRKLGKAGGGLAGAVSTADLLALQALLSKASQPSNHVWRVRNAYRSCKDFRILGALPHGILGHSAGKVYAFLERVGQVIAEVHEEATCDTLAASIVNANQATERDTDRRGLLLLTSLVERRAAKVLNAPGDHVKAALVAMRQAFDGKWSAGERVAMASYLASLGAIEHAVLKDEQLRQLRVLHAGVVPEYQLRTAGYLARVQWGYQQRSDAVDTLAAAIDAARQRSGVPLSNAANKTVGRLIGYLRQQGHFARGERFLLAEQGRQVIESQKNFYAQQLRDLYDACLAKHGEVSLGRGEALYQALRRQRLAVLWNSSWSLLSPTFASFCSLHRTAHQVGISRAGADFSRFASKVMPELSARFVLDQAGKQRQVAQVLKVVVGSTRALDHMVAALSQEPRWLRSANREYWRSFAYDLAKYNRASSDTAVKRRLRPLLVAVMQHDLAAMRWRSNTIFYRNHSYFWSGAAALFGRTANEFIASHADSEAQVRFAANYLWTGLGAREDAIAALAALHRRGKLSEGGRWMLVRWYDESRQHPLARPLVEALARQHPDRLDYRMMVAKVHSRVGDAAAARAELLAIVKRWTERKAWHEGVMARLGGLALECQFYALAGEWYEQAVRAHERSGSRRGNWRNTRSSYYVAMARASSKLGKSDQAIDAASAAVVVWGSDQRNRQKALATLHRVIAELAELDAYVERWARRVAETGMDAPLIRKHIGKVYLERGAPRRAIAQLLVARELQPSDTQTHTHLLAAYDSLGDRDGAIACLKASIRMSPMDLDLYAKLATRARRAGDAVTVERAYTSMVEVKPNEADSHRRLAKIRQNQRRPRDAVVQWQQVVRVRSDEPAGWLDLARAQIRAGDRPAARSTLQQVLKTTWASRFKDVHREARSIQATL